MDFFHNVRFCKKVAKSLNETQNRETERKEVETHRIQSRKKREIRVTCDGSLVRRREDRCRSETVRRR